MKNTKRFISIMLTMCMILALCPVIASAATPAYNENRRGGSSFSVNNSTTKPSTYKYNQDGMGGKLATDKIYYYASELSDTGGGYFSMRGSEKETTHDADSTVHEINFYLANDSTTLYFSPSMYNVKGYEYFLANGQHTTETGKDYFKSHNDLIQISSKGVYIKDISDSYVTSSYEGQYLEGISFKAGQWNTIAIRLPGLIESKGEPFYDENGDIVANKYAGEDKMYIYANGVEHEIPLTRDVYGARHIRVHVRGEVYLDNVLTYMARALENPADYKDYVQPVQIATTNSILKIDGDYVKYIEDITVGELKSSFAGADAIRVYDDATCTALLDDSAIVEEGDVLVAASKSGDATYEKTYKYYAVSELLPLEIEGFNLSEENGKILKSTQIERDLENQTYYLDTTIKNNTNVSTELFRAAIAVYDEELKMIHFDNEDFSVAPGVNVYNADELQVKFENVDIPRGATLKAFLWRASDLTPLCENIEAYFGSDGEYHILAFGNSYTNDSFKYLPQIAAADGITLKAVNMYKGSCPISTHHSYMKDSSKTYESRIEYLPDGTTITTDDVSFADGLNTEGYSWDFITMHQRGRSSQDFSTFYTEKTPYITELADYIRENSPASELMFFENWSPYTDRIVEMYDATDYRYDKVLDGYEVDEYYSTLFAAIRNSYLTAAETIENPNRVIPAGEAVYLAVEKYGFAEYVEDSDLTDDKFKSTARALYRDNSSHLTYLGRILIALTWYEYLTGNDARENPYQNTTYVSEADMELLKEIAHEACQLYYYNK